MRARKILSLRWLKRLEQDGALVEASWFGTSLVDRDRFRRFRHSLPELANDTKRLDGSLKLASDCAVPAENHREMLSFYREQLEHMFPEQYVMFDPIGDAHLHVNILAKTADSERAAALLIDFAREAVARGGTVSADHGLGWPGTFWSANGNGKL